MHTVAKTPVDQPKEPAAARRIGESLDAYLSSQGLSRAKSLATLSVSWEEIVGPDVAKHAQPGALKDGELVVIVDHPAWATQLNFLSERLLTALSDCLGGPVIERIKVHVRG
jgi:predicted nucleic acid-binding Zn ribbon protein